MMPLSTVLLLAILAIASPGELMTISGYAAVGGEVQSMAGVTLIEVNPTVPERVFMCGASRTCRGARIDNPVAAGQRVRVLIPAMLPRLTLEPRDGAWTDTGAFFCNGDVIELD
jgi:hypothetical protein